MLPASTVSAVITLYLAAFFSVNAYNILVGGRERRDETLYAEVERPAGLMIGLAAMSTVLFFIESLLTVFLGFSGGRYDFLGPFPIPQSSTLQSVGLGIMALGFLLFIWSVVARGRYSLSWAMPRDHALVTWGPYRYIRHPSYMGYFLMFLSLPLIMLNPVALLPLTGIPGYLSVARREEELLIQRFGEEYRDYMDRTGGFLPRIVGREAI